MRPQELVQSFFASTCGSDDAPDEEVISYIAGVLEDPDSLEGTSVEDLDEIVCSNSPAFEAIPQDARIQKLFELIEQIQNLQAGSPHTAPAPVAATTTAPPGTLSTSIQLNNLSLDNPASTDSDEADTASQEDQASCCPVNEQHVDTLAELCPAGTSRWYLAHVLQQDFAGDVQRAADCLLECEDVTALADAWQAAQERAAHAAQEEARAAERAKRALLERFHLQVVSDPGANKKSDKALAAGFGGDKRAGRKPEPQVRYRDGQVVSKRGEKFITEAAGEDWDGGSKGKVYTKGKRGKGFV